MGPLDGGVIIVGVLMILILAVVGINEVVSVV
jgi:hypothetical protein